MQRLQHTRRGLGGFCAGETNGIYFAFPTLFDEKLLKRYLTLRRLHAGLDTLLIAAEDAACAAVMGALKITPVCTDIRMDSLADKRRLARQVLASVQK